MGVIGRAFQVFGLLVLVLAGVSTYLYLTDYGVEATVIGKGEDDNGAYIDLETALVPYEVRHHLPRDQWLLINEGNFVVYHINTGHVLVYSSQGGELVYDSEASPL